MEKLKKFKNEHDHLLTKLLKVFLFSCVMIAPLIAGLSQWMYVICNKNAKDSYSDNYNYKQIEILNTNDIIMDSTYSLIYKDYTISSSQYSSKYLYNSINVDWHSFNSSYINSDIKGFRIRYDSNGNNYIYLLDDNGQTISFNGNSAIINNKWGSQLTNITFDISQILETSGFNLAKTQLVKLTYVSDTLDNAFYYGMEKMADSELFGWTKNTGIYTTINGMATGLGVNESNNILAVILTYWALMTAIYIIFDIIIELFIKITHLLA